MLGDIITFVPTTDPARAREFYAGTLGLELEDENQFALVFRINGTMLRVTAVQSFEPHPFTVLGWEVSDIVATIRTAGRVQGLNHRSMNAASICPTAPRSGIWAAIP
jgi:catechol 2,3-dioxygenase-like lactoylglutathione lyase family enzyme